MGTRITDGQDGRNAGRADAGEGGTAACSLLVFALLYFAVHLLFWVGRVILP